MPLASAFRVCEHALADAVVESAPESNHMDEGANPMVDKNDVAAVLELIRPSLQADGGDVKLVDVDADGVVSVELQGACKGCPMSQMTLANGVERILKERVPGVTKVVPALEM